MIGRQEILERAGELSLRPDIVEKDYVLGWLLAGIAAHPVLSVSWVFKGGTCLKKVHFETYRYSEDLDFTLTDGSQAAPGFLTERFAEIAEWVYSESGIEVPAERSRFKAYSNKHGGVNLEGRVYYRGPLRPGGDVPRIKLDLTTDEVLVLEPMLLPASHPYSDARHGPILVRSYPYPEVFAEKLRALAERGRPRDLYDVIHLYRRAAPGDLAQTVRRVLVEKCRYKGLPVPDLPAIEAHHDTMRSSWEAMLKHQLLHLPPFEKFWGELPALLAWLEGREEIRALEPHPWAGGEPIRGGLEIVRFAATNHLCVELDYEKDDGTRTQPTVAAYSLRRTSAGDVFLYADTAEGQELRSYRVDRIYGARVADRSFVPRFQIELTPHGYQSIPASPARSDTTTRGEAGPIYVFECSLCGKKFRRKRRDGRLRAHKDTHGDPCAGRTGYYVETIY